MDTDYMLSSRKTATQDFPQYCIFKHSTEGATRSDWKKSRNEKIVNLYCLSNIVRVTKPNEVDIGEACSLKIHKKIHTHLNLKPLRKVTIWKTLAKMTG